jgi:hypothetical protein
VSWWGDPAKAAQTCTGSRLPGPQKFRLWAEIVIHDSTATDKKMVDYSYLWLPWVSAPRYNPRTTLNAICEKIPWIKCSGRDAAFGARGKISDETQIGTIVRENWLLWRQANRPLVMDTGLVEARAERCVHTWDPMHKWAVDGKRAKFAFGDFWMVVSMLPLPIHFQYSVHVFWPKPTNKIQWLKAYLNSCRDN